ncbi:enolase C-terminal domain-like protein [Amycolatopsis aidingensis]|uniref:enolase C-terminal domain-like protein n=1 Tax=Amycolatopsis aidingensis TaxID=2842453 RepID=UPI001E5C0A16|nr:enolase C-terminal domain-like protein [Amycolatopsis aidingensis]
MVPVEAVEVHAFELPTDGPGGVEQDGTLEWDSTTMVLVQAHAAGVTGTGYTYGDVATATLVASKLAPLALGADALTPPALWHRMFAAIRNAGRPGVGAMAVSAVDLAVWDLKARLLGLPLYRALPAFHDQVPVYGSGGFTNYPLDRLAGQLADWVEAGIGSVKLKISREPSRDAERLTAARAAIGPGPALLADANGALTRKQALHWAHRLAGEWNVCWFEEPVSSDDPGGLRLVREHGPGGLEVAAGEYGFVPHDFAGLLGSVDCLQADVTRCGGVTGLLQVAGLCTVHQVDLSAHCAPSASAHAFCAVRPLRHLEYFHDHVRFEGIAFDGTPTPVGGALRPDPDRPGLGLEVRWPDLEPYRAWGPAEEKGTR